MTKEMKIYAGKCNCGRELYMRITDVKENEDNKNSNIVAWLIYGFCKRCKIVFMQDIFIQEEKPVLDIDFIVDYNKVIKGKEHNR